MLPLMFNERKFINGFTVTNSNWDNLLYDKSRYVKFAKNSKAFAAIFAKRLRDTSTMIIIINKCIP